MQPRRVTFVLACLALSLLPQASTAQAMIGRPAVAAARANKELVSRFYTQAWGAGNLSVADEMFAPGYILHNGTQPPRAGPPQSAIVRKAHRRIPGLRMSQE
ncbi:MAG: hypothetical protein AMS18_09030 [Gemmatimonas sp. SG8_17]|nr:MAG: hypothetical protein AMS18_09030 [Gemmatimonas sp. SG8_17]